MPLHRIETHSHTKLISPCGHLSPFEIAREYTAAGYSGIVVTDHLVNSLPIFKNVDSWPERVLEASGGVGVDLILDLVGGAYLEGNLRVMAAEARQIVVGVPSGPKAQIDLRLLMGKRALIKGTVLRARPLEEKISLAREFEHRVCPLFAARRVVPVIDSIFSPEEAPEAHRVMEENRNFGKLLLLWD